MNHQPWAFAVLTDPERIEDHARRAKLWLLKNLKTNPALASLKPLLEKPDYSVLHGAPMLVFILASSDDPRDAEDCCLAAENFMLAAREEELGTGPPQTVATGASAQPCRDSLDRLRNNSGLGSRQSKPLGFGLFGHNPLYASSGIGIGTFESNCWWSVLSSEFRMIFQ